MKFKFFIFLLCCCNFEISAQSNEKKKVKLLEEKLTKYYNAKDIKSSISTIDEILKIVPYHPRHLKNGFTVAYNLKDTASMMRFSKLIFNSQPENVTYGNYLLWFTLLKGQFEEAEKIGQKLYYIDRGNSSIIMNYAHAKYAMNKLDEAYKLYTESILVVLNQEELNTGLLEDCKLFHERFLKLKFDVLRDKLAIEGNKILNKYKLGNDLQLEMKNYNDEKDPKLLAKMLNQVIAFENLQTPKRYFFISNAYGRLANSAYYNGSFSQSIQNYLTAVKYDELAKNDSKLITRFINLGTIYRQLSYYDSANIYFNKAYSIAYEAKNEWEKAKCVQEYASLNKDINKYQQARDYYFRVNSYYKQIQNYEEISNILYKLGNVALKSDSAIYYYKKSLDIAELYEIQDNLYIIYNNLGSANVRRNDKLSIEYYLKALDLCREGSKDYYISASTTLANISLSYYYLREYDSAIYYLTKSNNIIKSIRGKLTEKAKLDFYRKNLATPQLMTNCYLKKNKPDLAFEFAEQTKSMLLCEKMGFNLDNKINIDSIRKQMNENQVYLVFSNMNSNFAVDTKSFIAFSKNEIIGDIILDSSFIISASKHSYGAILDTMIQKIKRDILSGNRIGLFNELIIFPIYYQLNLADVATQKRSTIKKEPQKDPKKDEKEINKIASSLSHLFYRQFVKPIEKLLTGKKELIILSDGGLSFVPFESLLNDENKYLGALYTISYLPSFKVGSILAKRPTNFSDKLLALGNPIYEDLTANNKTISNARKLYNEQNGFNWSSLPGTEAEVKSLATDFKNVTTLLGSQATEESIKLLSKQNQLKDYSIVHFATHGYVTTDQPELSTLVLNQTNSYSQEDGYLTAQEIEKLNIKANLVCLSACQTGRGLLKDGEGVMGLSNSFLLAGAKSTIVSMWSVSDDATSKFMSSVYQIVAKQKATFKKALFITRQKFINGDFGDEYKKPFYWSPFVYYGN